MAEGIPLKAYQLCVGTEIHSFGNNASQASTSDETMYSIDNLAMTASFSHDADNTRYSSDDSTLSVWNLNEQTRQAFHKVGATILLRAGFDTEWKNGTDGVIVPDYDTLPLLYLGTITHTQDFKQASTPDVETRVWLSTDKIERGAIQVGSSFQPGVKRTEVIDYLVKQMGFPVVRCDYQHLQGKVYLSGIVIHGNAAVNLTRVCKENGLQWHVHNKQISITRSDNLALSSEQEAWSLTPDSIISIAGYYERVATAYDDTSSKGKPRRVRKAKVTHTPEDTKVTKSDGLKTRTKTGVNVTLFLNGSIKMHDLVKIDGMNKYLPDTANDGLYRVIGINHELDYLGDGAWTTALKLIPANA
ncbi:TPA: hypothetical protein N3288_000228 [Klebsiella aerogenes]|nr:hypothetical protein [Klebsiella aerogenes]